MNKYYLGKGGFGEESWCSFFFGDTHFFDGDLKSFRGKDPERPTPSASECLREPGMCICPGAVEWVVLKENSVALGQWLAPPFGEVWIPRVPSAEMSWDR